jgi:hypothetical protein
MPLSAPNSAYVRSDTPRCEQGDIYRDVKLIEWAEEQADGINIAERTLPYCVLLSQDCDLEHDFNNRAEQDPAKKDKYLQSLLICPAYPAEGFRNGDHLEKLGMKMEAFNSKIWPFIVKNTNPRYHYLQEDLDRQVPPLVVDFKHYLTAPRDVVYRDSFQDHYLATMEILYRDNLSGRFAHYLSRVGLPELVSA